MKADGKNVVIEDNTVDEYFLPTYKIQLIAGRNFSPDYPSDSTHSVIVNESFLKEAGWNLNNAIGQTVTKMDLGKDKANQYSSNTRIN